MKVFIITALLALPFMSQAKTITVTGAVAREIQDLGNQLGAGEGAAGTQYMSLNKITCVKRVTNKLAFIRCTVSSTDPDGFKNKVTSTENSNSEGYVGLNLRRALNEATQGKAEAKTSPTRKVLKVKTVLCKQLTSGHELDDIDLENEGSCEITY